MKKILKKGEVKTPMKNSSIMNAINQMSKNRQKRLKDSQTLAYVEHVKKKDEFEK